MDHAHGKAEGGDPLTLLDENEQLRTALESALEENGRLTEDRDRLLRRVGELARELQATDAAFALRHDEQRRAEDAASVRKSETEEELRVALEELQVLTEELEVANSSLHQTNQELDARVAERSRQLQDIGAALRRTEASFRTLADLVPDLLWRADAHGDAIWFNQRWFGRTGQFAEEAVGRGWLDVLHPLDRDRASADWFGAVKKGAPYEGEHRLLERSGGWRWFLLRAEPQRDDAGRITDWFAAATDIHEQRMALEALRQSELRFRTLVEGMPQLAWRAIDGGRWTWCSPQWAAYTGQEDAQSLALGWLQAFHPDDRDAAVQAWGRAESSGRLDVEGRILCVAEGRYRHFRSRALPVRDAGANIREWIGTSTDVDDLVQLRAEQGVLVAELQHRTRNIMAVVQAVTMRTLRGAASLDDFRGCIDERLGALARVQGLLSRRESGTHVAFDALLREELAAHAAFSEDGSSERVTVSGPSGIPLQSRNVQTLALALHELATNAIKYGALALPTGKLSVVWKLERSDDRKPCLHIDWRETGVPLTPGAQPVQGSGYGRELIERALPYQMGARTTYGFESDGAHCTIEVDIADEDLLQERTDG